MRLTPIADRVFVRLDPMEKTWGAESKLIRPDVGKEKPRWGEVIGVGAGRITRKGVRIEPSLHRGDRVCVPWQTGQDLKIAGRLCVIVREADVLAVEAAT